MIIIRAADGACGYRPTRYKKGKGKGFGRAVTWDREAILDAASLWAVRNASGHRLMPSKKRIEAIKHAVAHIYESPFAMYNPTSLTTDPNATWESVTFKFVDEGYPELPLFPGKTLPEKSDVLNELAIVWICAREKARRGVPLRETRRVVLNWKKTDIFEKTTIEAADHDEVIHEINGVDMRKVISRLYGR